MTIALDIIDAIELAEVLDWINDYFNTTIIDIKSDFDHWAGSRDALDDLTHNLTMWANLLRTTPST